MSSFVDYLIQISNENKIKNDVLQQQLMLDKKDELYKNLTDKYHPIIKKGIMSAAKKGKREKYINFDRYDFKANFPGIGYPKDIQQCWLDDVITNPSSDFLPRHYDTDMPEHLNGLIYEIWNNKNFTTKFSW